MKENDVFATTMLSNVNMLWPPKQLNCTTFSQYVARYFSN